MARFSPKGINSEVFQQAMVDAGPVECSVNGCGIRFMQGNKGQTLNVCIGCTEYLCNDHLYRHPNCEEGR